MEEGEYTTPEEYRSPFENFKKVTPLSKYLAMALFVILPFLGGYIGYVYAPEKVVEVEKVAYKEVQKEIKTTKSTEPQLRIPDASEEFVFKGYHLTELREAWGQEKECHVLKVLYDNDLSRYYIQQIKMGNTVQTVDSYARLHLSLPWDQIPIEDQEKILDSSSTSFVEIRVRHKVEPGTEAFVCHSFVEYIGLEP